jgi:hypothetical protein
VNTVVKVLMAVVVVAGLGFGGLTALQEDEQGEDRSCGTLDTPSGSPVVPAGLTLRPADKLLRVQTQGKTTAVFVSTADDDLVKVRDEVLASLVAQGYSKKATDEEPGIEAEAEFGGKGEGTIKVKPLCTDRLEIRYKLNG